jgi:MFS family permease
MSMGEAFTTPWLKLSSRAMTYYAALTTIGFFAVSAAPTPLYHYYQRTLNLSPLLVTLIFAAYSFSMLAAFLTVARLSDYVGRRPMILAALLINALALVLFISAQSAGTLILARIVQGVGTGIATTTLGATILDTDRKNGSIYNSVTAFIGLTVGVLLAGVLLAFAPMPGQLVYIVLLVVTVLEALILAVLPETAERRPGGLAALTPHVSVPVAARPVMMRLLPLNVAGWALGGFYLSLMPTLVAVATHVASPLVGAAVVSVLMVAAAIVVLALRARAAERLLFIAVSALGVGIAVTLVGTALQSVPVMIAGTAIAGIGFGSSFAGNLKKLLPLADPSDRASLLAAYYIESYLAFSLPAIGAGLAAPVLGLETTAYLYGAVLIVLALVSFGAMVVENRPPVAVACPG